MPPLDNPRHEIVAQQVAKGLSQRAAYIRAGYQDTNIASVDVSASRLISTVKVTNRIQALQERSAMALSITIEGQLAKLERVLQQAELLKQCSASIAAIREQSELAGLKIQRLESKRVDQFAAMSDEELEAYVNGNRQPAEEPPAPARAPQSGNGHDLEPGDD